MANEDIQKGFINYLCGRCHEWVDMVYEANCTENPEVLKNTPLGMYHCPDCGAMIVAGSPHPRLCKVCIDRKHPAFDFH